VVSHTGMATVYLKMKSSSRRDLGIVVLRTFAMLMIVLCHFFTWGGVSYLPQFLSVGVFVFLLISGWLYSDKDIQAPFRWLYERWKKICIPILIWVLFVCSVSLCFYHQRIGIRDLLLLVSNLQGLSWILPFFPHLSGEGLVFGLAHLWFITVLFCCYFLLCFRSIYKNDLIVCLLLFALSICLGLVGINLFYLTCFFLGSTLKKVRLTRLRVFIITCIMILAVIVRLVGRHFLDGTSYYNVIIVSITQIIISVWLFVLIKWLVDNLSYAQKKADNWLMQKGDILSYHIYITHYLYLCPLFNLHSFTKSLFFQVIAFIVLTLISAVLLKWISDKSIKYLSRVLAFSK